MDRLPAEPQELVRGLRPRKVYSFYADFIIAYTLPRRGSGRVHGSLGALTTSALFNMSLDDSLPQSVRQLAAGRYVEAPLIERTMAVFAYLSGKFESSPVSERLTRIDSMSMGSQSTNLLGVIV